MPAPNSQLYQTMAKQLFWANRIRLPTQWSDQPDPYSQAFSESELITAPIPPDLYMQATLNKCHVDTAHDIGADFKEYIEGICGAICFGIDTWMKLAMVTGMIITGPVGILRPGCIVGPPLLPFILARAPMTNPGFIPYNMAIASTFSNSWSTWSMGISGTLMYPAFAAFPGPMAPPMPNIPMPLIALPSAGETMMSPSFLANMMLANLGNPMAPHARELFNAIAQAFAISFLTFKASTMLQNVLGFGPIPTFAPPFVPVGPVIMGSNIPTPGVLM